MNEYDFLQLFMSITLVAMAAIGLPLIVFAILRWRYRRYFNTQRRLFIASLGLEEEQQ